MSESLVGIMGPTVTRLDGNFSLAADGAKVDSSKDKAEPRRVKIKFTLGKKSPTSQSEFAKGKLVEATSDEKGFEGSWFTANVIDYLENDKYLVEYLTLTTNDESGPLREEVCSRYIRPYPPHLPSAHLKLLDRVDAWYNEGWWEGVISKVLGGFKFIVYFATANEELVFDLANLRHHQDWISGRWVITPKVFWTGDTRRASGAKMTTLRSVGVMDRRWDLWKKLGHKGLTDECLLVVSPLETKCRG